MGDYPSRTLKMMLTASEDVKTKPVQPCSPSPNALAVWPLSPDQVGRPTLAVATPLIIIATLSRAHGNPATWFLGIGPSPDKMLLGRSVRWPPRRPQPHRRELQPAAGLRSQKRCRYSYSKDGPMAITQSPTRCTRNSKGGPRADAQRYGVPAGWHTDGEMVRTAYTLRAEDDNWGQAGTLVRDVMHEAKRDRLVDNIIGHLLDG